LRSGHREAQIMFEEIGRGLGYEVRRTWSRNLPTDGVWLGVLDGPLGDLPMVAIEVVVSEGLKSVRGSLHTLTAVSPALGILCLQDEEIRRGLIRAGLPSVHAARRLERQRGEIEQEAERWPQRIEVWGFSKLRRLYQLTTGRSFATAPAAVEYGGR
jgi:hypothetical protein